MGSRGPAPLPTKLKVLHGERRASRLNDREPQGRGRPVMPADMTDGAKRAWRRVMRAFGDTRVITAADLDTFRAYCEAVDRYLEAAKLLAASGPVVRGARKGELVKNPLHQVVRDNAILMRALARELGLTPSARTGLQIGGEADADPFDAWAAGTGGGAG
jgi:P27 family predicted phage terminase small subunit